MFKSKKRAITIPQSEHARLAGYLAYHWGNADVAPPPLDRVAFASGVTNHDRGYGHLDSMAIGEVDDAIWNRCWLNTKSYRRLSVQLSRQAVHKGEDAMHAAMMTKANVQLKTIDRPVPDDHEVRVRVYATTITAGDVVLSRLPGFMFWSPIRKVLGMPPRKSIPGHEFAGVVDAIGKDVTAFKIGEAVFGTTTGLTVGANAEYVCVPETWAEGVITFKPDNMTFEQAAVLPMGSMTALYLLKEADIQPGEQVLVYGASGSVGTYAVQLARYFGADVTGVCSSRNVDLVKSLGAKEMIDYTVEDFSQRTETYDLIFDAVGKVNTAQRKRALKPTGRYTSTRSTTQESSDALALLADLAENGQIRPVIDRSYSLHEFGEAYQHVASKRKAGNVVVRMIATADAVDSSHADLHAATGSA